MTKLLLALSAVVSMSAYAGDNGGGTLKCKSDSGRTKVEGGAGAPYNGEGPASLTLTIDGVSVAFDTATLLNTDTHLVDYVVYSHKKSYTVGMKRSTAHYSNSDGRYFVWSQELLQLRSLPGTMTEVQKDIFRFKALIPAYSTMDPRQGTDLTKEFVEKFDKDIQVNCELDVTL